MTESFDGYYEWLGISPKDQPPNHYRLLGVDLFEPKAAVIEHAADQRMALLRTFQTGRHSALSQRLLNEVAAARISLLKADKRAAYDAALRKQLAVQGEGSLDSDLMEALRQDKSKKAAAASDSARKSSEKLLLVGIGAAVLIGVLGGIVWLATPRVKPDVALRPSPKTHEKSVAPTEEPPIAKPSDPAPLPAKPAIEKAPPEPTPKPAPEKPSPAPPVEPPKTPAPKPEPAPNSPSPTPAPQSPTPNPQSPVKLPVPEGATLEQATKAASTLFQADLDKAKTPADKVALAKQILAKAVDPAVDAAGRYALLRMAGELAVGARDAETAFQCVDQIDAAFEVDRFAMKTAILTGWAKDARSTDARKSLIELLFTVGDEALDAGNVDAARELGKLVTNKSAGLRDKDIIQRLKAFRQRFTEAGKDAEELQQAQAFLAKDASHAPSNLVVGRYLCFTKGDWEKGLPRLLLGSDPSLKRLAEQELKSPPTQPNDKVALADAWWEIASGSRRSQMNTIKVHAGQWYRQSLAALPAGLGRSNVEKRLAELKKLRGQLPALALAPFDSPQAAAHQRRWADYLGEPVQITNSIGMKLILIPPGEFDMGSTPEEIAWALEEGKKNNEMPWYFEHVPQERPRHRVKISRPYYLAMHPVTQGEYESVMGVNPSAFCPKQMDASAFNPPLSENAIKERPADAKCVAGRDTTRHPVETVSWNEATEFCRRLSELPEERGAKRIYRLPTEAEWEYACRAGTTTRWWCGDDEAVFQECAWYKKNAHAMTHPVGEKRPSPWGLYDMHGQVWQWCMDWYDGKYYGQSPSLDPTGPPRGANRAARGSIWGYNAPGCRSAFRSSNTPGGRRHNIGLRVCLVAEETTITKPR